MSSPPSGGASSGPDDAETRAAVEKVLGGSIPPGFPVDGIANLLGNENIVLESVSFPEVAPGEGPIGADGKVISPEEFLSRLPEGLAITAPEISSPTIQRLDPSEAPNPANLHEADVEKPE